jgi:hypothetical protein
MTLAVKETEAFDPIQATLLRSQRIPEVDDIADAKSMKLRGQPVKLD